MIPASELGSPPPRLHPAPQTQPRASERPLLVGPSAVLLHEVAQAGGGEGAGPVAPTGDPDHGAALERAGCIWLRPAPLCTACPEEGGAHCEAEGPLVPKSQLSRGVLQGRSSCHLCWARQGEIKTPDGKPTDQLLVRCLLPPKGPKEPLVSFLQNQKRICFQEASISLDLAHSPKICCLFSRECRVW